MASFDSPLSCAAAHDTGSQQVDEKPMVDPFLVELLQNPRYRLIGENSLFIVSICVLSLFLNCWIEYEYVQVVVVARFSDSLSFSD